VRIAQTLTRQSSEVFVSIRFAGILGSIALVTIVLEGLMRGAEVEQTLEAAAVSTALLCVIGYVVGKLASWVVVDSVRVQLARELSEPPPKPRLIRSMND
jgi:hypothetical protein